MISKYVMGKINTKEVEGVKEVQNKIDNTIKSIKIKFTITVFLILFIIILASLVFSPFVAKTIIAISIWFSILYTLITLPYKDIFLFIFKYKINFYQFLYVKVKEKVFNEYNELDLYEKVANNQFGKDKYHIVHSITSKAYYEVKKTLLYASVILSIAYIIFIYFRNSMIDINQHINFFDLLIFNF